ncbi:MAG: rhomboid family intramembrane serine protease, partial [Synechococcus sp. TMED187]
MLLPLVLVGIAWLQELLDTVLFGGQWSLPLGPGTPWWSVFTAPFSHSGFG